MNKSLFKVFSSLTILALILMALPMRSAQADNTTQSIPFSQNWTTIGLITVDDNWSGVPGIIGYRGDGLTSSTGVNPQTVVADGTSTPVDVNANQTNPNTFGTGGVTEFHIANPVVAMQGSGTARAPFLLLHLNTTGFSNITVAYNLRDIDGSADNTSQPFALQYRVGSSGNFTNIPAGFVADATTGPSIATLVTPVSAVLPAAANNQPLVQVRIITTDAAGTDEMVGVDDISVTGSVVDLPPFVSSTSPVNTATNVALDANIAITFSESVNATGNWYDISCANSLGHTATVSGGPTTITLNPNLDFINNESCTVTVYAAFVTDQDGTPDNMTQDFSFTFTTVPAAAALVINEIDYDQPSTDTAEFIEIRNNDAVSVNLGGYSLVLVNGTGGGASIYQTIALPATSLSAGDYFVVCADSGTTANCDLDVSPDSNLIQNGDPAGSDPDAVALLFMASIIDTVSYEGNTAAPYTEGSGAGIEDSASNATGISRCPDGVDTNVNNADFSERNISPGTANLCDTAPAVASTFPINGATDFPVNSNLTVTFSEAVTVSAPWFTLVCSISGPSGVTTAYSGGATTFTLDPGIALVDGETCTLTILANQISDVDGNDPPDNMVMNFVVGFSPFDVCVSPFTPIYTIQGSGLSLPTPGTVSTKGVVVGDFEGTAAASGFYIQDLSGDGNTATSDGIFVFTGSSNLVSVGQVVRVTGFARERFNQTTLNGSNLNTDPVPAANIVQCGTGSVAPVDVTLPVTNINDFERYEGMLVRFPQALVIAEYFNYDRFGEIVLAQPLTGETRPFSGTAIDAPGTLANARTLANSLSRITLDDVQSAQNPPVLRHPNGLPFSLGDLFRGGDTVANAIGVLGYDFNLYRIVPTGPVDYTAANPRPAAPEPVGGTVRVAAMNTLNFFVTANYPTGNPLDNKCGPLNNVECRGWDSNQATEFIRQRDKLLTALSGLNGDIIGLNELENSTGVEPLASITSGMPGYAYINTGTIGTDAIKVGLIYRPAVVTPVGSYQILDSSDDTRFIDTKSRPSLAQTFQVNATGARFTVVVNHLKSKGSACTDVGDPDLLDGQGNCSQTRRAAAEALVDWLADDPTGSGDPDFIIMGDLNSYAKEDAINEILDGSDDTPGTSDDFTNLIAYFQGAFAYSYTFDGQAGYLDHALANTSLLAQITGAEDWHINSDEPDVLDYDTSFKPPAQDALYEVNPYRTSDHDPVVVGLIPNAAPTVDAGGPYSGNEGSLVALTASGSDPNGDSLTYAWDLDNNGSFETSGQSVSYTAPDGPGTYTVNVKATDPLGLFAVASTTVDVANVAPSVSYSAASGSLSCGLNNANYTIIFSDPAPADTHTAVVDWGDGNTENLGTVTSSFAISHTYALVGTYTATVTVTDDDGGVGSTTITRTVNYNTSGFLQPINADGTSVFKYNSTIPVKIRFTNCDGSIPANLAPTISLTMISGSTPGLQINEPASTSAADTTGVMRFSTNQYIYNLATKPLPDPSATYLITVTVPSTGQIVTVQFGLRP